MLSKEGVSARVVSMPSWELFRQQPQTYRDEVLPPGLPRLAVEAASPMGRLWPDLCRVGANRIAGLAYRQAALLFEDVHLCHVEHHV